VIRSRNDEVRRKLFTNAMYDLVMPVSKSIYKKMM
jgi:hypothetical protein